MLPRRFQRLLLSPGDLTPSRPDFEVIGAFNPAAIRHGGEVLLLVRVAERPAAQRAGMIGLPRWAPGRGLAIDWLPTDQVELTDPRVVRVKATGLIRLTFWSYLRLIRCGDGRALPEITTTVFGPEHLWEEYGVEDPRLTQIGERVYFTYVAVSRHGVTTALASTTDFHTFERHGILFCPENKDVVLFPERIAGRYAAVHRPVAGQKFSRPEMWLARSDDLLHWGQHQPLLGGREAWENERVGAGPPPLLTDRGWLLLYHGSQPSGRAGVVGTYANSALLLDRHDPASIIARSKEALIGPETDFELQGFVPGVVFPTGIVETENDSLLIYYGAADTGTAVLEVSKSELLAALK